MSPVRRIPPEPFFPPFDPDPRYVEEDPDPRVPIHEPRRRPDGVPGMAIVLAIVGIPLLVLILVAIAWRIVSPPPAAGGQRPEPPLRLASQPSIPRVGVVSVPALIPAVAVRGVVTWYDAPSSRDAAAGPSLRRALGRHWRGTTVQTRTVDRCVTTRLTDTHPDTHRWRGWSAVEWPRVTILRGIWLRR